MNDKWVELVQELVSMARYWGLSEGSAAIYASLALSGKALTMPELQESTGYSLSSVSTNLRSLTDKYLVTKKKREGVYVYKAEIHFEEIFKLLSRELLERNIQPLHRRVAELKPTEDEALYQHFFLLKVEMEKLIDYLEKIIALKGEAHAVEEDKIFVPSVS